MAATNHATVLELTGEAVPVRVLLRDLARRWRLLPMLARKDYRGRYRSASMGLAWSVFLPMLQGAVLAVVFTQFVRIPTDQPYPVFVLAGITTWSYFSQSLASAATAIVDSGGIAGKLYFPRMILPAVPILSNAVGYAISMGVVVTLLPIFDAGLPLTLLALPAAMLLAGTLAYALGALASVGHVYFRDIRYIVSAGVMVLFYATPVIYPPELAGQYRWVLDLNPATGMIGLIRWSVFGEMPGLARSLASTAAWIAVLLVGVLLAFRRHERVAVDRL